MVDSSSMNVRGHCIHSRNFMEQLTFLDFPLESVEEGSCEVEEEGEDWNAKLQSALGPIPFDFLSRCLSKNIANGADDLMLSGSETVTFQDESGSEIIQSPHLNEDNSNANTPKSVQPLSPISVLETSNSRIPKRARSKRSPPLNFPKWASIVIEKDIRMKKKGKIQESKDTYSGANVSFKRCSHCQVTHTPQWREGPMGPKTLCNACGVRYRSGRLFPEYRPIASPDFVLSLHSNSHKKVLEMRNKSNIYIDIGAPVPPCHRVKKGPVFQRENSPPPDFIPMSGYLLDCVLGSEVFNC